MKQIIIGVDPHKLSATIEVVDQHERLLGSGRFATDKAGYAAILGYLAQWSRPTWAVEGSNGAGRSLAQRLVADGHHVVDVPAKLAARVRLLDTGHGRKTDAHDAHAVAAAAVRAKELRVLAENPELESLRMVIDRRDELTRQRVQTVNRLHRLLAELIPGTAKRDITALQAKAKLASVRPRDLAGKTRRRIAADELVIAIQKKIKTLTKDLNAMVEDSGSSLTTLPGDELFMAGVHIHGGPAPVRRFLPELIQLIWERRINPGRVFDLTLPLDKAAEGYRAMDQRTATKVLLTL